MKVLVGGATDKAPKGRCVVLLDGKGITKFTIPTADMAKFMVEQLNNREYIHKLPIITGV